MTSTGRTAILERPDHHPWVLVNLIRFNHRVTKDDGETIPGALAYDQYFDACRPVLDRFGAKVLWAGDAQFAVAGVSRGRSGESQSEWDRVVVIRYPTPAAYRAFVGDPQFRQALALRNAAVAETQVLVCSPDGTFEPEKTAAAGAGAGA